MREGGGLTSEVLVGCGPGGGLGCEEGVLMLGGGENSGLRLGCWAIICDGRITYWESGCHSDLQKLQFQLLPLS